MLSNILIIVRGLPGAGKSTMAEKLVRSGAAVHHFEADMYFVQNGEYKFDSSKLNDAHEWCRKMVMTSLRNGHNTVVSNTFVRKWEVEPYINMCNGLGIDYVIIEANGEYDSVHNVPEETIKRMRLNWEKVE